MSVQKLHVSLVHHGFARQSHSAQRHNTGTVPWYMRCQQALKQAYSQECPRSAMHVQGPIDSRNPAIHNDYRTSLRPSSMLEPRYSSLEFVKSIMVLIRWPGIQQTHIQPAATWSQPNVNPAMSCNTQELALHREEDCTPKLCRQALTVKIVIWCME
jgi:hypothetical protein